MGSKISIKATLLANEANVKSGLYVNGDLWHHMKAHYDIT
jgi:hypothetical protein